MCSHESFRRQLLKRSFPPEQQNWLFWIDPLYGCYSRGLNLFCLLKDMPRGSFYFVLESIGVMPFLQHVSIACYAERCISYSKSVRPSVCPSYAGTESKRLKLRSWGLHWIISRHISETVQDRTIVTMAD